jgi:hypothetical protein
MALSSNYPPNRLQSQSGLPDFSWYNIPKWEKLQQVTFKYTKWPQNIPNGHKIYQHLSLQDPPKFTQIGILGLKICHLATLFAMKQLIRDLQISSLRCPISFRAGASVNKRQPFHCAVQSLNHKPQFGKL